MSMKNPRWRVPCKRAKKRAWPGGGLIDLYSHYKPELYIGIFLLSTSDVLIVYLL